MTGGTVDPERGMTARHEQLQWRDMPLGELLARASGLPVRVDNHARALTQAEILFGHRAARRSMVQLFVGHVVDAHRAPRRAPGRSAAAHPAGPRPRRRPG
ncbi:ROK family protein [Kitasatospora sp. NPDC050467]|uniref:ROK family protein n=1 Tax=Kitasatospora sp. NPDC050467 TaxID=3364053 RepID=UPI00378A942A